MSESTHAGPESHMPPREEARPEGQATLSAIGDVSMAATAAVGRVPATPKRTRWVPILGFLLAVYVAGSWAAIYAHKSPPWAQVFVAPLVVVLIATLAFWRRQVWKYRARHLSFRERAQQDRLNSFAHETANGLNSIRANLTGVFEESSPQAVAEHRKQVEEAMTRIAAALIKAIGMASPQHESRSKRDSETSKSKAA